MPHKEKCSSCRSSVHSQNNKPVPRYFGVSLSPSYSGGLSFCNPRLDIPAFRVASLITFGFPELLVSAPGSERREDEGIAIRVRVFFHDKCFDGVSSAAVFSRFYRERVRADAEYVFSGLVHRAGALFDEEEFDGDENAIVDFKYSSSPRITWWFDHHESAFLTPADAQHFRDEAERQERAQAEGHKPQKFYGP